MGICTGDGVLEWMLPRLGRGGFTQDAVGFGLMEDGRLIAAAAFDVYRPHSNSIEGSIVFEKPITRRFLQECFCYAFLNLGVNRVQAAVNLSNPKAIETDLRIGFTIEGVLRRGGTDGGDAVLLGMLKDECKWLSRNKKLLGVNV